MALIDAIAKAVGIQLSRTTGEPPPSQHQPFDKRGRRIHVIEAANSCGLCASDEELIVAQPGNSTNDINGVDGG